MPLPENFSEWEHLQHTLMQVYNRHVRASFKDVGDDRWEPNINTPRASLRVACTMKDGDSAPMALIRMLLFYGCLQGFEKFKNPIYGIPITSFQESRRFKPQIQLYFQEPSDQVEIGYAPVTGEISFRLMNENPETITEAELRAIARKIKTEFGAGNGYIWKKGKLMASYVDRKRGYQLQLLVFSEQEARNLIAKILDIQNHTPDWKYLNFNKNDRQSERYPTIPRNEIRLGRSRRMPRQRPVANVKFRHAVAHIHGLPNPVVLVDLDRVYKKTLLDSEA